MQEREPINEPVEEAPPMRAGKKRMKRSWGECCSTEKETSAHKTNFYRANLHSTGKVKRKNSKTQRRMIKKKLLQSVARNRKRTKLFE